MSASDAARDRPPPPPPGKLLMLLFGVAGGPVAWVLQLLVDYALSALACFPNDHPLSQPLPGLAGSRALLLAVNLAALAIALVAAWVSLTALRAPHPAANSARQGRIRFMAGCGVLTGLGFALAILFDTVSLLAVPQCLG